MISAPCHGAVVGAWLGAWPMPLDWERPWQVKISFETDPVCCQHLGMKNTFIWIHLHTFSS
jgi:hypothetical protein